MALLSPKMRSKRWFQCLKVEKRLIDVEDDQRKGGHVYLRSDWLHLFLRGLRPAGGSLLSGD